MTAVVQQSARFADLGRLGCSKASVHVAECARNGTRVRVRRLKVVQGVARRLPEAFRIGSLAAITDWQARFSLRCAQSESLPELVGLRLRALRSHIGATIAIGATRPRSGGQGTFVDRELRTWCPGDACPRKAHHGGRVTSNRREMRLVVITREFKVPRCRGQGDPP